MYVAFAYVLPYFLISLVQNVILFSSEDFLKLTTKDFTCPTYLMSAFIISEFLSPLNFVILYITVETVARKYHPIV